MDFVSLIFLVWIIVFDIWLNMKKQKMHIVASNRKVLSTRVRIRSYERANFDNFAHMKMYIHIDSRQYTMNRKWQSFRADALNTTTTRKMQL